MAIIIVGIGVMMFNGDDGLNNTMLEGHERLQTEVRSWGYDVNP